MCNLALDLELSVLFSIAVENWMQEYVEHRNECHFWICYFIHFYGALSTVVSGNYNKFSFVLLYKIDESKKNFIFKNKQ